MAPIPWFDRNVGAFLGGHRLQLAALLRGLIACRRPNTVEQPADVLGRLGHGIVELVVGERLVAQQLRPFAPQSQGLCHDLAIIGGSATLSTLGPLLERLLAQISPGRENQKRLDQRARESDDVAGRRLALGSGTGGGIDQELR